MSLLCGVVWLVLFQQLVMVTMVAGALSDNNCDIDDNLPSSTSLTFSVKQAKYTPGQLVAG